MNSEIERETHDGQTAAGSSMRAVALTFVWMLVFVLYVLNVAIAVFAKGSTAWADNTVFSGAILCFNFDRRRMIYAAGAGIPLIILASFCRIAPLHASLLTLGCAGVLVLAYCALNGDPRARQNAQIALLLPLFAVATIEANYGIAHLTPHLLDAALLRLDFGIGGAIRSWTLANPMRLAAANFFYGALPLAVAAGIAFANGRDRGQLLRAACVAAILAVPCYFLAPAVGPAHMGERLAARNCMPSMHLAWALLVWFNVRRPWLRRCALAFVVLTALSTLATGEHYVVDLIAALPFAWVVQQLTVRKWPLRFPARRTVCEAEKVAL